MLRSDRCSSKTIDTVFQPSPTLQTIARGQLCAGCGGCAAVAPDAVTMEYSQDGFLRPVQKAGISEEAEEKVAAVCPGLGLTQDPGGRWDHPLWGPMTGLYTGYATDPALRQNGSSGGALSAILVHLLESGTIDHVLQTGAAPDLPFGNRTVTSINAEQVFQAAGSRYAPSAPLDGLERWLTGGCRTAFVGKPCDVAALRSLAQIDPRVQERFPVMLSFFCAGVPSINGARKVVEKMGGDPDQVVAFRFRGDGWPGFAKATMADGSVWEMSYADSWGGILSGHVQFRCRICPDGTGGFADIVCADAWETDEHGYPLFEEREGVSLIVSRTENGERILQDAMAGGAIEAKPFDAEGILAMQPGQKGKRRFTLPRLLALKLAGKPAPRYDGFHLLRNTWDAGLLLTVRNFLGTLRRIVMR
ncbi:Coenzyme F420 hydrogenase/dehydrogenase, beta subunit C-terminal domain [Ruegeria sp. Alg231-54]|uniref:Coenzyme F420 hydrogenase/dehydrogenase, beta subunit C-terminal domain n=1 Tax=Ruegeria sp. Alg231-54 TaxID=1922221 RepID=UPI000D54E57F|nr:Coenzyme F420 hydrogenase/dehydrogenase, beta subunit C-terminal domain [Ruegeria sp. Alg231-54]